MILDMIPLNTTCKKGAVTAITQIFGGFQVLNDSNGSLGIVLWQILKLKPLPSDTNASVVTTIIGQETDQTIIGLIGDCFDRDPTKRPRAFELFQRLMDEYNRRCAEAEGKGSISDLLERCREKVQHCRISPDSPPKSTFSKLETSQLLEYGESWESEGSGLRLAPEVTFLIGAGLLWDLIDPHFVQVSSTVVGRGSSSIEGNCYTSNLTVV